MSEKSAAPQLTEKVVRHFDQYSASGNWSQLYKTADGTTYHFHIRRQRVLELLPERLGRVADLGCGPGVMVEAVLERGGTFDGVDLSPEMVREGREKYGNLQGVTFREGSVEALDLPDEEYDQVVSMGLVEYLTTPDRVFSEIARILRPGGIAVVTIPKRWHIDHCAIGLTSPLRPLLRRLGVARSDTLPRLRLQPDELDRAAQRAGLTPDGGAQYCFTLLPFPFTRVTPTMALRVNAPLERWHASRNALQSFFAHGYIGRYRKP